jgi:hypothetical protein
VQQRERDQGTRDREKETKIERRDSADPDTQNKQEKETTRQHKKTEKG